MVKTTLMWKTFILKTTHKNLTLDIKKTGCGVSLFLTCNMIYSRRNDIIFNSEINSVTVDI